MKGCYDGQKMSSVTPQSGTEIWYSYWKVIEYMKEGQTLAIISDLQSNVPLTSSESASISRKAQAKQIKVIFIK